MSGRLEQKVAVITGIASGQGRAAALLFAAEGCKVVGCDLRGEGAQETVEMVRSAGGQMASFQPCDLTDPGQVKELIELALTTYGGFDIVYNNAGTAWFAPMEEMTTKIWRDTLSSELDTVYNVSREAWPHLIARGGGSIINVGSLSGKVAHETASLTTTNKKIALFTDTEQDGIVMGNIWQQNAPKYGYTIAYHASFPVGTTNFSSQIAAAKASGAQVLIAQMIPPDAMTLWKQMKSLNYHPIVAEGEKGAGTSTWPQGLGDVAEGTLCSNFWSSTLGYPGTSEMVAKAVKAGLTNGAEQSGFVAGYDITQVIFDAIAKAGSTDPNKMNTAIGQTDKTYTIGPLKFGANHADAIPAIMLQWQKGNTAQVYPQVSGITFEAPTPGLA